MATHDVLPINVNVAEVNNLEWGPSSGLHYFGIGERGSSLREWNSVFVHRRRLAKTEQTIAKFCCSLSIWRDRPQIVCDYWTLFLDSTLKKRRLSQ